MTTTYILIFQMLIVMLLESLAKEVPDVAEKDQYDIRDVRRKQVVVRWLVFDGIFHWRSLRMLRYALMACVA